MVMTTDQDIHIPAQKKPRGRPSQFDADTALQIAMQLFWAHGYEGTSIADLTAAMGINKPSLYAAFGSKEALFAQALEQYIAGPIAFVTTALEEPTAYRVVAKLLLESAHFLTEPATPHGCMINTGSLSCGPQTEPVKNLLIRRRQWFENALIARMQRASTAGELAEGTDATTLARYVATIHRGMSIQAASGASRADLLALAQMVLKLWPGEKD